MLQRKLGEVGRLVLVPVMYLKVDLRGEAAGELGHVEGGSCRGPPPTFAWSVLQLTTSLLLLKHV